MKTQQGRAVCSLDELNRSLRDSRLFSASRRKAILAELSGEPPAAVRRMIEQGLLTSYQGRQVLRGRGRLLALGPYRIEDRMGAGGMGRVYRAVHRVLKRPVALKVIRVRPSAGASRREEMARLLAGFRQEVEAHAHLEHPHIATAFDAGKSRGLLYLALEYIPGIDLERLVASNGPLPLPLACEVARQAALALHHAHGHGWVHRDVKPANLILTPSQPEKPGVGVKLLDLGLARLIKLGNGELERGRSCEQALVGTPDFMAPELALDSSCLDPRSDLYSLGCTFYFLLTGQVPHPGGSWTEKLLHHRLDRPRSLQELRPAVPPALAAIVESLLAPDPTERCPSAAALLTDLYHLATPSDLPQSSSQQAARQQGTMPGSMAIPAPSGPPSEARSWSRWITPALMAVLCGIGFAWVVRQISSPPSLRSSPFVAESLPQTAPARPYEVGGKSFVTFADAVAFASDGGTVTVCGPGPYRAAELSCAGKALTVRGEEGTLPCLELSPGGHSLLSTDRELTLERLELRQAAGNRSAGAGFLVDCKGGPLKLRGCRLWAGPGALAVVCQGCSEVSLSSCQVHAGHVGISVQSGAKPCWVRVTDCQIVCPGREGVAFSLWASEIGSGDIAVDLERSRLCGRRILALRQLPVVAHIEARACSFSFEQALLSFHGYPSCQDALSKTRWEGEQNSFAGRNEWLTCDDEPAAIHDQAAWGALWRRSSGQARMGQR